VLVIKLINKYIYFIKIILIIGLIILSFKCIKNKLFFLLIKLIKIN